jgi:putative ABC transport system ATP-binding protein
MKPVIEMKNIVKNFAMGDVVVRALRGVDINIKEGEFVAIMGASGSGKSTLMNIIGCLDVATDGEYQLAGNNTSSLNKDQYADIRNQKIGFVFQGFNLLSRTTALENVELPLLYDRLERIKNPREQAKKALESVGLADRMDHVPNQLSGGQQQRVAIARALVNDPAIILADEPTGNLDSRTSVDVMSVFQELNKQGKTIILVTHETDIAEYAKRNIKLQDGKIIEDKKISTPKEAKDVLAVLQGDENEME